MVRKKSVKQPKKPKGQKKDKTLKNKWNKDAIEADNKFLAEQDKIEPSEPSETQANQ